MRCQPGPDAYKTVPNSSLVVARTAFRDNKSRYTINDRASSYTEVTTLLKDRGIDLTHKRFLILQVGPPLTFLTRRSLAAHSLDLVRTDGSSSSSGRFLSHRARSSPSRR